MLKKILLYSLCLLFIISCARQESNPISDKDQVSFKELFTRFQSNLRNQDSASHLSSQLLAVALSIGQDSLIYQTYIAKGISFQISQSYDSSIYFFHKALSLPSDDINKVSALNGLGEAFHFNSQLDSSLYYYQQAAQKSSDKQALSLAYSNIGTVLNADDMDSEAIDYFKKAIELAQEEDNVMQELPPLLNIATVFMKINQLDSAILYAQEVEKRSRANNIIYGVAKANYVLASAHLGMNELSLALTESKTAADIYEEINSPRDLIGTQFLQSKILYEMGLYTQSLQQIKRLQGPLNDGLKSQVLEYTAKNLFALNRLKEAYEAQTTYHDFYVEVVEKNKESELAKLQYQFDTRAKTAEIRSLENENTIAQLQLNQRNGLIIIISSLLFISIAFGYMYLKNSKVKSQKQVADLETKLLRTQLNPHFLFNAMGAIQQYIFSKEEPQKISDYLGKFSRLTRMILNYSKEEFISLEEELTFISHYVELQQIRFENPFDFELEVDPKLDQEETLIPPMLTQPFIENAIEHGLLHKNSKGHIRLIITEVSSEEVEVIVEDNGIGRKQAASFKKHSNHHSHATEITRERLKLLQRKLKKTTTFKIIDLVDKQEQAQGTRIHLSIPLIKA